MSPGAYFVVLASMVLVACGNDDMADLVKGRKPGPIDPLPMIEPIDGFSFAPENGRDPFVPERRNVPTVAAPADNGMVPDPLRPREALEQFPLDALTMVGTLARRGTIRALIKTPDRTLVHVGVGNYLGTNHGRITRITEDEIELTERVFDRRKTSCFPSAAKSPSTSAPIPSWCRTPRPSWRISKLEDIRRIVQRLDVPVHQVMIESRVVVANNDFARDLGVRFGFSRWQEDVNTGNFNELTGAVEGHIQGTASVHQVRDPALAGVGTIQIPIVPSPSWSTSRLPIHQRGQLPPRQDRILSAPARAHRHATGRAGGDHLQPAGDYLRQPRGDHQGRARDPLSGAAGTG